MSIQCRPEPNALTTPHSYRLRFVPRNTADEQDLAQDIHRNQPNFSPEAVEAVFQAEDEAILERLLNGEQVTRRGSFSWYLSFTGKLENADDPTPPLEECLQVNVRISRNFLERLRQAAHIERLPMTEKLPVITAAEDTLLNLRDVLRPDSMLRITGRNLLFNRDDPASFCLLEGTRNGSAIQSRVGTVTNSEIVLMPDVPAQSDSWNNEYQLSVTTRYTEHGTSRTGIYKQLLRTPLTVILGNGDGILSGAGRHALVTVSNGNLAGNSTQVRIQALLDSRSGKLGLNLLDMRKNGVHADTVMVSGNGLQTLPDLAGSPLSGLEVDVRQFADLKDLIRTNYGGRLVDILDVQQGS